MRFKLDDGREREARGLARREKTAQRTYLPRFGSHCRLRGVWLSLFSWVAAMAKVTKKAAAFVAPGITAVGRSKTYKRRGAPCSA